MGEDKNTSKDLPDNKIDSFIRSYKMDDSVVNNLIEYIEDQRSYMKPGTASLSSGEIGVNTEVKNSLDISLPYYGVDKRVDSYFDALYSHTDSYVDEFNFCNTGPYFSIVEPVNYQEYPIKDGGFHLWHSENTSSFNSIARARHLVFMTYLNDIEDGGETQFYHQSMSFKPKKGYTLIWPGDWTHTHRGVRSNTEIKKIVTGWYSFHNENVENQKIAFV